MNHGKALTVLLLVALIASSASAFDGHRRGFVLGGGLGMNFYGRISPEPSGDEKQGLAIHVLLGFAQNEHNLLALEGNMAWHVFTGHGYFGPAWYRYFGRPGKAFFSVLGLGWYYYNAHEFFHEPIHHRTGLGYMLGGGYEFARHFQAGLYYTGGHTSSRGTDYDHNQFSILISFTLF